MSDTIEPSDLTIADLFSVTELERENYDPELGAMYCQYIMEGKSLQGAAEGVFLSEDDSGHFEITPGMSRDEIDNLRYELRREGAKYYRRFSKWRVKFKRFDDMVNLALKERCYAYVEEMVEIADDATDDAIQGATGPIVNGKAIRRAELMINTRKFLAAKMLPKVFGDKTQMELTGADGKDLVPTTINVSLIPAGSFVAAASTEDETDGI